MLGSDLPHVDTFTCSTYWNEVAAHLSKFKPLERRVSVPKGAISHPTTAGFRTSIGLDDGQLADYRMTLPGGAGLHVHEYAERFEAHIDSADPDVDFISHLRNDAPVAYVWCLIGIGAVAGLKMAKRTDGVCLGAALGLIVGLATVPTDTIPGRAMVGRG